MIEFLGQKTDTTIYYEGVLEMKTALDIKRRGKLHSQIVFHDYNAPAHSVKPVKVLLREVRWKLLHIPLIAMK